ncbi:MAG: sigma 54-interacting transcriptional regulator [Acidobacteriaceae bacterium]|nr:sigma 54-interacting transcriptional regulator [Acidobacteriaceae bacterium]
MASLEAIAGPLQGAIFHVTTEDVSVGRHSSNHLCVGDPSVSRQHCLIQPLQGEFIIRDLGSNNGTSVNGNRVNECMLADGDKIRIGDTVFRFASTEDVAPERELNLPDNGVRAVTASEQRVSDSAETIIQRLVDAIARAEEPAASVKTLLRIGAVLNTSHQPEELHYDLLKSLVEITPAEHAAIILLAQSRGSETAITGWDAARREPAVVSISRTLVTKAIEESVATFSDNVSADQELETLGSLAARQVGSVITVPIIADARTIGAIYLDSTHPSNRLTRKHLELTIGIAEFAGPALDRATRLKLLKEENSRLQSQLQLQHNLIGFSPVMRHITERIARIARTDATVVIRGETGTGKELAARAIHQNSSRAARPFEAINCSLLRETLLDSELFGHEKGSFTGAIAQKKGKLELADGGTLFLDELAELGERPQAMLLRVLQTREFQRLGGSRTMRVDIRIITATNENLEDAVAKKAFREDLYYRLNVVSITMPPLRERQEDIPLLADHFVQMYSRKNKRPVTRVSQPAMSLLLRYDWPGNVRELENAIEHAVVFGLTDEILPEDLPGAVLGSSTAGTALPLNYHEAVCEAKRNIVRSAVLQASGNYGEAAKLLGIHVNNLHRLMRELQLKPAAATRSGG